MITSSSTRPRISQHPDHQYLVTSIQTHTALQRMPHCLNQQRLWKCQLKVYSLRSQGSLMAITISYQVTPLYNCTIKKFVQSSRYIVIFRTTPSRPSLPLQAPELRQTLHNEWRLMRPLHPAQPSPLELETQLREDFTTTEKAFSCSCFTSTYRGVLIMSYVWKRL